MIFNRHADMPLFSDAMRPATRNLSDVRMHRQSLRLLCAFACAATCVPAVQAQERPNDDRLLSAPQIETSTPGDPRGWPYDTSIKSAQHKYYQQPLPPEPLDNRADTPPEDEDENYCNSYGPNPDEPYRAYNVAQIISSLNSPRQPDSLWMFSAHRGVWGKPHRHGGWIPENSLQALRETGYYRFESVELDIHLVKDSDSETGTNLVLMHDYAVGRFLDGGTGQLTMPWDPTKGAHGDYDRVGEKVPVDYSEDPDSLYWDFVSGSNALLFSTEGDGFSVDYSKHSVRELPNGAFHFAPLKDIPLRGWTLENFVEYRDSAGKPQTPIDLEEALTYIGNNFPGMIVVLDLRHLGEVKESMRIVDKVVNCQGLPARHWVIFKPFANVFPDGWNAAGEGDQSVSSLLPYGEGEDPVYSPFRYLWIPVISNRLNPQTGPGTPSMYPGSVGPDTRKINLDGFDSIEAWMADWVKVFTGNETEGGSKNTITFELGTTDKNHPELTPAQSINVNGTDYRNVISWRPPVKYENQSLEKKYCLEGYTPRRDELLGYNWKDDGMGLYPNFLKNYRCPGKGLEWSSWFTVENAAQMLRALRYDENEKLYPIWNTWQDETTSEWDLIDIEIQQREGGYVSAQTFQYQTWDTSVWSFQTDGKKFYNYPEADKFGALRSGLPHVSDYIEVLDKKGRQIRITKLDYDESDDEWTIFWHYVDKHGNREGKLRRSYLLTIKTGSDITKAPLAQLATIGFHDHPFHPSYD